MIAAEISNQETGVPNIIVKVPEGAFDAAGRARLGKGVTGVAKTVEQIGDDPRQEATTLVIIEEVKAGCFLLGGNDLTARVLPVVVMFHAPGGVLDPAARAEASRLMQAAVMAAKPDSDPRPVVTSLIMSDVPDGTWGVSGALWQLDDFVKSSGYKHLQHRIAARG